jgi:predicted  nucleic acid-binding Zn-ribbon protein
MEKLSGKKRLSITRHYLSGLSYDEIAAKNGVSKGTVANVVADLKAGRFPEATDIGEHIDLLRELSLDLKRLNLTPGQCATGLTILSRINECGLDPSDIDRWPAILKSVGGEGDAQEFVEVVYAIQDVQKRTGLSLEELRDKALELEKKAAELEPMSREYEDCRKRVAELTGQRDDLASEVAGLEHKYGLLNPRVKALEKRERDLSRRIDGMETKMEEAEATLATLRKEKQGLREIGLSLEALAEFNERVQSIAQRHHISPAGLRNRLLQELENLGQAIGLEALVQRRQGELEEAGRSIDAAKEESESLKRVIGDLKQDKKGLEDGIKEICEKVGSEMLGITAAARDMMNRLAKELRRGYDEALAEVQRLNDEAMQVGKEVGRYQEMLQVNQWLSDLVALARGEETIEGKRVRAIALLVLRGTAVWLKRNKTNNLAVSNLSYTTESLIREMEQWKA